MATDLVRIRRQRDVMDPASSDPLLKRGAHDGARVADYLPDDFSGMVWKNTGLIPEEDIADCPVEPGDLLELVDLPEGGTFGRVFKGWLGAGLLGAGLFLTPFLPGVGIAIAAAGASMVYGAIIGPKDVPVGAVPPEILEQSPSRGFRGAQNTYGPGRVVPMIYGTIRTGGHIVQSSTDPVFTLKDEPSTVVVPKAETDPEHEGSERLNTRIVLCHGPIESISAIKVDGNPIENLTGATYEVALGTKDQLPIEGFEDKTQTLQTPQTVLAATPITETTESDVKTVEVELFFTNGLYAVSSEGAIVEATVNVDIEYTIEGGSVRTPSTFTAFDISAAHRGPWSWWGSLPIFEDGEGIYDVTVRRNTADSAGGATDPVDAFQFASLQEVRGGQSVRSYPGFANIGVRQVAQSFQGVPRAYTSLVSGFNDIRIYTDETTYTTGFSNNPAWCCMHFITHKRLGLGEFYDHATGVDIASFLAWAEHCDEMVSDGRGAMHKRCTFNHVFDTQASGRDMLSAFTAGADAYLVEDGGKFKVVLDIIEPPSIMFAEGNYIAGTMQSELFGKKRRADRITATFLNEEKDYKLTPAEKSDLTLSAGSNYTNLAINSVGITRPRQMTRQLFKVLQRNKLATEYISIRAGIAALTMEIGDVFQVASRTSGVGILTGRTLSYSSDFLTVELDGSVTLDPAETYELSVMHADKTLSTIALDASTVTDQPTSHVTLSSSLIGGKLGDNYSLAKTSESVDLFRCISLTMAQDFSRTIVGEAYSDSIYDEPTDDEPTLEDPVTINQDEIPGAVRRLTVSARKPEDSAGNTRNVLDVNWAAPSSGAGVTIATYQIFYRIDGEARWRQAGVTSDLSFVIDDAIGVETYGVAVVAVTPTGRRLALEDATKTTVTVS